MAKTTISPTSFLFFFFILFFSSLSDAKTPLFIFGDSLYDTGMNLYSGETGSGARYWPYGETFFKKPVGRFCDGRTIPDYIAQFAGLPYPQPYLKPGLNDYSNGVNFASAAACVLVDARPNTINLKMQVEYFAQLAEKLKKQVGVAKANQMIANAVYLFNIGGNDYVSLFQNNVKKLPLSSSYKRNYMGMVLGNFTIHLKTLYSKGARKFAFQNVGPLGCMPSMKYMLGSKGGCEEELQMVAKLHNAGFLALVQKLQPQLPGFKYSVYDFYTSCSYRVYYGKRFGFTDSQDACCGSGTYNGKFTCQVKGTGFKVCSNPNDYLWFDAAHTSDKANYQFGLQFWSGGSNVVAPYNIKSLF